MKGVYITSLLLVIGIVFVLFLSYQKRPVRLEAFNVSVCQKDSDCPMRFKCDSGKCADTRPSGN